MNAYITLELIIQRETNEGYPVLAYLTRGGDSNFAGSEAVVQLDLTSLSALRFNPGQYGEALGKALFTGAIRDLFIQALGYPEHICVLLTIEDQNLRSLEWRRLCAPFGGNWKLLATQQKTPFSINLPPIVFTHLPSIGRQDLKALVVVADPQALSGDYELADYDVAGTAASVQSALGTNIPSAVLESPSLSALCKRLTDEKFSILHIVSHGRVDKKSGETQLFIPKDTGERPVTGTEFIERLKTVEQLPYFIFLSTCEGAAPQAENGLGSLATRLVRELGIPAVVAMTDQVSMATAQEITCPFYGKLYEHGKPDLALVEALSGLQEKSDVIVPVVISSLRGRPLFSNNLERELTDSEIQIGLDKMRNLFPRRAPILEERVEKLGKRLLSGSAALGEVYRKERAEALSTLDGFSLEVFDLSFRELCYGELISQHYDERSPFRGLESFRPEDREFFFGREGLTEQIIKRLGEYPFLAILGASGSGKSSLVMAGVIPSLGVRHIIMRPGATPLFELEKALQDNPDLLVVDQFEELFTLNQNKDVHEKFIHTLMEQQIQKRKIILTMRADFLGEAAAHKPLKEQIQQHQEIISPLDVDELHGVMIGQADTVGLHFESDLSQRMLDEVAGEPGAMPLLQHALWELWNRRHGRRLLVEEYRAFGGVRQAIAHTADKIFSGCSASEQTRIREIFIQLTRLDETKDAQEKRRDTRRRVLIRDLTSSQAGPIDTQVILEKLATARLIVKDDVEVEIAHEALIRHWGRLSAWLNVDRESIRLQSGVAEAAREWDESGKKEEMLVHQKGRLDDAIELRKNPQYPLSDTQNKYLDACMAKRAQEQSRARRLQTRIITILAIALTVVVAFAASAWVQRNHALARQLAAQAQSTLAKRSSKQMVAVLLATRSMQILPSSEAAEILLSNTVARIVYQFTQANVPTSLSFNPDGSLMASNDGSVIHIWDMTSGKSIIELKHAAEVDTVLFSPDGKYLASGSHDYTARIWEVESGREISQFQHDGVVHSIAFSPDGKYVVSSGYKSICVWETINTLEFHCLDVKTPPVRVVAFSPDGKLIAAGAGVTVRVWDFATYEEIARKKHGGAVNAIAFSPDSRSVASGSSDSTLWVWEIATENQIVREQFDGAVISLAFSPDGKYVVSGNRGETASIMDIETKDQVILQLDGTLYSVAFSPDGKYVATGGYDKTARVWDAKTGIEISRMTHKSWVMAVAFSPDNNQVVSGDNGKKIIVWDAESHTAMIDMQHDAPVFTAQLSPNGKYAASAGVDKTIKIWETATGREVAHMSHDGEVYAIAFSPDGKLLISGSGDKTACIWEVPGGRKVMCVSHYGSVSSVAFSPDGNFAASAGEDRFIRIWAVATGEQIARMNHDDTVNRIAFSLDGALLISSSNDKTSRVWDSKTGRELSKTTHDSQVYSIAISPDNQYAASGSFDGTARVWRVSTGQEISHVTHDGPVYSIFFLPGNKTMASGGGYAAMVWDLETGKIISAIPHEGIVQAVAISTDGKTLASGDDKVAHVWDIKSGMEISRVTHGSVVDSVVFSTDGKYVVSGGYDRYARMWLWRSEDLIENACTFIPRNLTRDEWNQYLNGEAYQAICPNLPIELEPTQIP